MGKDMNWLNARIDEIREKSRELSKKKTSTKGEVKRRKEERQPSDASTARQKEPRRITIERR